ncbi:MAG: TylF/MycF family methyltransferase, partial [Candidatus Marsarchaeota archaeon]|nr:TylF/MycF family methyltransferase [Candidatus Marsarchaeota archaeon]
DTFEGFPSEDLESGDNRFKDTSVEVLRENIGDLNNIVIRKGYFPETTEGLEDETFSFVMLDLDLYKPTLAGLEFFYPRMKSGAYIFAHDYNSPESNWAVSRAVNEFMSGKPEQLVEIPDTWGSIGIRKI